MWARQSRTQAKVALYFAAVHSLALLCRFTPQSRVLLRLIERRKGTV